jgi:hypothetical protein
VPFISIIRLRLRIWSGARQFAAEISSLSCRNISRCCVGEERFFVLDNEAANEWRALVNERRQEIESLLGRRARIGSVEFAPFFTMNKGHRTVADEITRLCQRRVPDVYWYYYFSGLLRTWKEEPVHVCAESLRAVIVLDEANIWRQGFAANFLHHHF